MDVILPGKDYGWPFASYGRDYMGQRFNAQHTAQGFEEPTVYWVPSIAVSGMTFYNGDRFPNWRRNLFVGGMREGEMSPTGNLDRIVFSDKWQELRRESLLRDLHQRVRDVRQGPDGRVLLFRPGWSGGSEKEDPPYGRANGRRATTPFPSSMSMI